MKKLISTALAGCMMLSGISAMAADINITIDNEEFIPKNALGEVVAPFIENGSTYLPVRAMGEAVGKAVKFDAENYAVYIGEEPKEEDKTREAYMLVGDRVIYQDEIEEFTITKEDIIEMVRVIKLAESTFTEEEIKESYDEMVSWVEEEAEKYPSLYYYAACNYLVNGNVPEGVADYSKYVTAKHILTEDEAAAIEVIDKLNEGLSIEDLIDEYNIDPGQRKDSSYTFTYGEMVEEFEKAAFDLEVYEYTKEPVESAYGYHVIARLPLNTELVDAAYYQNVILPEKLEKTDYGRIVEVKRTGAVGNIEGFEITAEMLDKLFSAGTAKERFEVLTGIALVKKIMDDNGLFEDVREEYKNDLMFEMGIEELTDEKTYEYILDLGAAYIAYMREFSNGNVVDYSVAELFENEENYPEIENDYYRDIKVFVDGKLIVPCDVNNNYVEPKNVDGTVYVPVRAIVEALGMTADWDSDTRTVVITK